MLGSYRELAYSVLGWSCRLRVNRPVLVTHTQFYFLKTSKVIKSKLEPLVSSLNSDQFRAFLIYVLSHTKLLERDFGPTPPVHIRHNHAPSN